MPHVVPQESTATYTLYPTCIILDSDGTRSDLWDEGEMYDGLTLCGLRLAMNALWLGRFDGVNASLKKKYTLYPVGYNDNIRIPHTGMTMLILNSP